MNASLWTTAGLFAAPQNGSADGDDGSGLFSVTFDVSKVIALVCITVIIALSIFGNSLVILALALDRNIKTAANYLIGSLALADLLVSLLVMPIRLAHDLTEIWIFGAIFCDIYISLDVLCCTASILSLTVIALDRFWAITKPLQYVTKRTPNRAAAMIVSVWIISALVSIPPLFGWRSPHDKADPKKCLISQDLGYTVYSTVAAFYLPLAIILFVYWKIFRAAKLRIRRNRIGAAAAAASAVPDNVTMNHRDMALDVPNIDPNNDDNEKQRSSLSVVSRNNDVRLICAARERKAAKTLGIVIGAFVLCWLPFFILALVLPFCKTCQVHPVALAFFAWLGYVNSMLNPIIYTFSNKEFKKAFTRVLKCKHNYRW
ncbi:5-hydroxytryptamine receptor 1A-like [Ptychodera flava]|uniref:5-hydroxytryptamine receptor 1A-like n=1 Tax=Ptychodera flava TaxID=63121 RepID=UPI00396AB102